LSLVSNVCRGHTADGTTSKVSQIAFCSALPTTGGCMLPDGTSPSAETSSSSDHPPFSTPTANHYTTHSGTEPPQFFIVVGFEYDHHPAASRSPRSASMSTVHVHALLGGLDAAELAGRPVQPRRHLF
jgi:hypothetical protein